jgi:8-oxo-dGTP diphosphatase
MPSVADQEALDLDGGTPLLTTFAVDGTPVGFTEMTRPPTSCATRSTPDVRSNPYSVSVAGVVLDDNGRVLLVQRRCRPIGGHLTTSDETSDFRWASRDELGTITTGVFAVRLLDGVNCDGAPAVRYHDGEHLL